MKIKSNKIKCRDIGESAYLNIFTIVFGNIKLYKKYKCYKGIPLGVILIKECYDFDKKISLDEIKKVFANVNIDDIAYIQKCDAYYNVLIYAKGYELLDKFYKKYVEVL